MKATALEFRLRFWILLLLVVLGFLAPWDYWLHLDGNGPNTHLWGSLAAQLSKAGVAGIGTAFDLLLGVGVLLAICGAWLRTWGAAYLGSGIVQDGRILADGVVVDGPYRYVRNPLYLGTWLHILALSLLMPASGGAFAILLTAVFQVRLILAEEAFLAAKLGTPFAEYSKAVPRLLPSLRPRAVAAGNRPRWVQAVFGEIYMWGVAVSFAAVGWRYNAGLLTQCVLVSLGVSLVVRAVAMQESPAGES